jgi:N-acetylmuramoyl-L-alanine amidase
MALPALKTVTISALLFCGVADGFASARRSEPDPYERAVNLRTALEAAPPEQRTKLQFEQALDAFREVYHAKPGTAKAPAAVAAVGDLLAEKGRLFHDQKALRAAIGQYEFLREQYPRSPQVENALLLEGDICRQDLHDQACAEEKFRAIVATQPGTSFAEQAALELREMQAPPPAVAKAASGAGKGSKTGGSTTGAGKTAAVAQPAVPKADPDASVVPDVAAVQAVSTAPAKPGRVVRITGMRHWSNPTSTRIAIDLGGKVEYEAARVPNPDRIFFDLHGAKLAPGLNGHSVEVVDDGFLKRIRAAQSSADVTRVVLDVTEVSQYSAFLLPNPWRLIIDIHGDKKSASDKPSDRAGDKPADKPTDKSADKPARPAAKPSDSSIGDVAGLSNEPAKVPGTAGPTSEPVSVQVTPKPRPEKPRPEKSRPEKPSPDMKADGGDASASSGKPGAKTRKGKTPAAPDEDAADMPHAADPSSDGQRSLVRALGLKVGRIVIDAGHGGHDSGTLGPGGIQEKDVVLDVALRVGKLLHDKLGAEIVYTRADDTFIPLETRTAIANKAQADLFLSIHANSSQEPSARGVETYYLNFTSDPSALDTAARENAVSNHSVHQLSDLVKKITLKDKIDESREFAADVDASLYAGLKTGNPGLKDRGVKKAPFVVLIGAQMPSILAEISFLTNPDDARQLREDAYKQRLAESLVAGVGKYLRGLSGTRPTTPSRGTAKAEVGSVGDGAGR